VDKENQRGQQWMDLIMKYYLTILFALISIAAFGKIYPATDYAGSNIMTLNGPAWIQATNGFGTNTSLVTARDVGVTTLAVFGTSFLNNSNVQIYQAYAQPVIVVSGAGLASANGTFVTNGNTVNGAPEFVLNVTNYISYGVSAGPTNWNLRTKDTNTSTFFSQYNTTNAIPFPAYGSTWTTTSANVGAGLGPLPTPTFTFYITNISAVTASVINSTSNTLQILATNGVNIIGNALYFNGVPIVSSNSAGSTMSVFQTLWATNSGTGYETNYKGLWTSDGQGTYTNLIPNYRLYSIQTNIGGTNLTGYLFVTNRATFNGGTLTNYPGYISYSLIGNYSSTFLEPDLVVAPFPLASTSSGGTTVGAVTNGNYATSTSLILAASNSTSGRSIIGTPRGLTGSVTNSAGQYILSVNSGGANFDGELALRSDQGGTVDLKASTGSGTFSGDVQANNLIGSGGIVASSASIDGSVSINPALSPITGADPIDLNGDGSAYFGNGAVWISGGILNGNASGVTNIPVSGLSTNGGNINQVPVVSASGKVVWTNNLTVSAITATNLAAFTLTQTNFIPSQSYLNANGYQVRVSLLTSVVDGTSVGNVAGYQLWVDPAGGTAWQTNDDGTTVSVVGTLGITTHYKLQGVIPGGATYLFTNRTSGGTATLISGTGQISAP
jgi:hypothetical protein